MINNPNTGRLTLYPKRPLLAATIDGDDDVHRLEYPLMASVKIDGIRCLIHPQLGPVTRSLKEVPNRYIHRALMELFEQGLFFDGELITRSQDDTEGLYNDDFNTVQSYVMSRGGQPNFRYVCFDMVTPQTPDMGFKTRHSLMHTLALTEAPAFVSPLVHLEVDTPEQLLEFEQEAINMDYEGIMTRHVDGPYKEGRSTFKQGILLKLKRWADAEGTIIGWEELMVNENNPEINLMGLQERKKRKDGMIHGEMLGAFILDTEWGELRIGSGMDVSFRTRVWENPKEYQGQLVNFKFQKHGTKNLPRFPIFKGIRHKEDT